MMELTMFQPMNVIIAILCFAVAWLTLAWFIERRRWIVIESSIRQLQDDVAVRLMPIVEAPTGCSIPIDDGLFKTCPHAKPGEIDNARLERLRETAIHTLLIHGSGNGD